MLKQTGLKTRLANWVLSKKRQRKAIEPDPAWLEEPALAEAESAEVQSEAAEVAAVDDLPEMTLAEPAEIQEVAAAGEVQEDEIGEFGLIEEMPQPAALEPDPAWLEEPSLAAPAEEIESEPAEVAEVDYLPEMTLAEPAEIQEIAVAPLDAVHEDTVR